MSYEDQLAIEQVQVDRAYQVLDSTRINYRDRQRKVEKQGSIGSPQNRSERDAMAAYYGDQAARLEQVEDRLVFGRLTPQTGSDRYIGRVGLYDDHGEQVLVDWRAQAAVPFYQATAFSPMGMQARRHIGLHNRQVISVEDELLDLENPDQDRLVLQGEGALMAALKAGRSGRMHDIVATIQAEQDRVIRSRADQVLVVQGGPGTGKTAVALHRAAFLLYDRAERLAKSGVLIVGPSPAFLRYIEQVLPALGETGVVSTTIERLLPGVVASGEEKSSDLIRLKGDLRWAEVVKRLVSSLQRVPKQDVLLVVDGFQLFLRPAVVSAAIRRARLSEQPHNQAREVFVRYVLDDLTDQYLDLEGSRVSKTWEALGIDPQPESSDNTQDRTYIYEAIRNTLAVRREVNLCWMPYSAQTLLRRFFALPSLRQQVAGELFSAEELDSLQRIGSQFSRSDIAILDELEELLGPFVDPAQQRKQALARLEASAQKKLAADALSAQGLGDGLVSAEQLANRAFTEGDSSYLAERALADRTWVFGHVVVDEAQELSPLEWRALLRRCPSRSFTVVGDLAQSVGPVSTSWRDLLGPLAEGLQEEVYLTVCYRTPQEIMDLAEAVSSAAGRPSPFPVRAVRSDPDSVQMLLMPNLSPSQVITTAREQAAWLDRELEPGAGRVAIIAPDSWLADLRLSLGSSGDPIGDRICILSAETSKGLEFDCVVLVQPAEIGRGSAGNLFVAMTRSTRRLCCLSDQELPAGWD